MAGITWRRTTRLYAGRSLLSAYRRALVGWLDTDAGPLLPGRVDGGLDEFAGAFRR